MKTVVITGSTRGIGLGLAKSMLERGANVVITSRNASDVERTVRELNVPHRVHGLACDVTRYEDVEALWAAALERFGRVDIWINNAGATTTPVTLDKVPADEILRTVMTNLVGALYGSKVAARGMKAQGSGQIYNMEGLGSRGQVQEGLLVWRHQGRRPLHHEGAAQGDARDGRAGVRHWSRHQRDRASVLWCPRVE